MKKINLYTWVRAVVAIGIALSGWGCAGKYSPVYLADEELHPADVIVVLGYGPPVDKEGRPADELVRRVKAGVELYQAGLAPVIIMTGGNTYKEYYESEVMKKVAVEMGVPPGAVLEERQAMDTIGNARYSAELMREHGWSSCIVVSSPYHLKRARKLFQAAGLEVQTKGCEVPDSPWYGPVFTLYELLVRVQYLFINEEELVKGEKGEAHTQRLKGPVRARTKLTP